MDARYAQAAGAALVAGSYQARLLEDGYCIVPNLLSASEIAALNRDLDPRFEATPFCQGDFYGETTKRFGSLLKRSSLAQQLVLHPLVLSMVRSVLGRHCDDILLNLTQAIEIHPGAPEQFPHRDQDMWGGPKGTMEYLVNVMWPLVPFSDRNGATVVWPGSHREQDMPMMPPDQAIPASMDAGSALLFLGSTLHAGGANRTNLPRRGVIVSYCLGWLRPFEAQTLIYPPQIAQSFPPELAALLGYGIHRPNLGNYEGQPPSVLFDEHRAEYLQARDALKPDQAAFVAQVMSTRRQPSQHLSAQRQR